MRHHRRAEDADGDVEHVAVVQQLVARDKSGEDAGQAGLRPEKFRGEAEADGGDEHRDEGLDVAEALVLQIEHGEHVGAHDEAARDERDAEEQLQADGGADDLGEVARGDGDFAEEPLEPDDGQGIVVAAGLGEIAAGDDAELDAEVLQQNGHEIGDENDAQQRVAELRAALQVGGPVARVHVTDRDEKAGAGEGEQLAPEGRGDRHDDAAVDLRQRVAAGSTAPGGCIRRVHEAK
jgi:hypothetical protein